MKTLKKYWKYPAVFIAVCLLFYGCQSDDESDGKGISQKTITIDGDFSDWSSSDRIYQDNDGIDCNDAPGRDIREVYLAQDDNHVYFRMVMNDTLDPTFGYRFGGHAINSVSAMVEMHEGVMDVSMHDISGDDFEIACVHLPQSFLSVSDNQFEAKLYKYDLSSLEGELYAAWCDQGFETVCRDYNELGKLDIDFSAATVPTDCAGGSSDTEPPETVTLSSVTALSSDSIEIVWQLTTDNVGVAGYRIYVYTEEAGVQTVDDASADATSA